MWVIGDCFIGQTIEIVVSIVDGSTTKLGDCRAIPGSAERVGIT
jgi:hypothetical protein